MKRTSKILRVAAVCCAALLACAATKAQSIHLPPHEKIVLKNGLTVLLMEKQGVPLVSFAGIVKTGAVADPPGKAGLASITAGLLRKGTKTKTAEQFSADLDFIGGTFGAGAGSDFSSISAEFMTKDLGQGLDLVSDALMNATFPQTEVDKLLAQSVDSVKGAKDDPNEVLGDYFDGYLFGKHPYARPSDGDEITLKNIQRDDIVKFYEANYAPGNMILAVAGQFDAAEMKRRLEEKLGAWPAKEVKAEAIPTPGEVKGKKLLLVDKPDATQTYFAIGNVGTAATEPDRVALRVVNTVFGGRFTSELNEELRVKSGLTYGAYSYFDSRKEPGPFVIGSFTKNATTTQAIDLALETLKKLHTDGLSAEQLASAKSYIKGQFPPRLETSGQLARQIAIDEYFGLDDSEINDLEKRIDAVTVAKAKEVIAKHYPEDNLVFVLIGKASEIGPMVRKYAEKEDTREISAPGFWPGEK